MYLDAWPVVLPPEPQPLPLATDTYPPPPTPPPPHPPPPPPPPHTHTQPVLPPFPHLCSGKCEDRDVSGCRWTADITNEVPCDYCFHVGFLGMFLGLFSLGFMHCLSTQCKVSARAHWAICTLGAWVERGGQRGWQLGGGWGPGGWGLGGLG